MQSHEITSNQLTSGLNPEQAKAVLTTEGPLLILAGAGSGKTRVLTHRMAQILCEGLASSDEVLCVTFTNKAAREMEHRIYKLLREMNYPVRSSLWVSTFHSFCVKLLRSHITLLGYKPLFTIYDPADQLAQVKKILIAQKIDDKLYPPKNFLSRIGKMKMSGLSPLDVEKLGPKTMDSRSLLVYRLYEEEMLRANALDFDDLLLKSHLLLKNNPDLLARYQEKFRYIMVDEYQDTNHIQYLLVMLLAQKSRNLCVVGDEDQSIYSWRGADISNILDFERDFPETKIVKLEENYRSSANIVNAATALIKHNTQRKDKTLRTSNPYGAKIIVREENNEHEEARYVTSQIESYARGGTVNYNDFAIFYRTNAQSRVLEDSLRSKGIPHRIVGGLRFYERMEIKDVLSYLRLIVNPSDDMAFKRILNVPTRGLGKTTMDRLESLGLEQKTSLLESSAWAVDHREFNAGTTGKLRKFLDLIRELTELYQDSNDLKITTFYQILLDRTGYLLSLEKENTAESQSRIENLEEFANALEQFQKERGEEASLQSFLEEMALISDQDSVNQEINSVTLMTIHISKGLEFPYVFIVGLEENLFPSLRSDENRDAEMEEERRLAYVGITRARERLFLTHTQMRRVWGQEQRNGPSRFLNELPSEYVEVQRSGLRSGFAARHGGGSLGDYTDFADAKPVTLLRRKRDTEDSQEFPDYENSSPYKKGMKVKHPTFGVGAVFAVEGSGDETKVSVLFTDQTLKKFIIKYARLEKVF